MAQASDQDDHCREQKVLHHRNQDPEEHDKDNALDESPIMQHLVIGFEEIMDEAHGCVEKREDFRDL